MEFSDLKTDMYMYTVLIFCKENICKFIALRWGFRCSLFLSFLLFLSDKIEKTKIKIVKVQQPKQKHFIFKE